MDDISVCDWLTIMSALGNYYDKYVELANDTYDAYLKGEYQKEAEVAVRIRQIIREKFLTVYG